MALNLTGGVCLFCSNETKLLVASLEEKEMLRDILLDFLNTSKFSTTLRLLKLCPFCLWELHRIHNKKIHGFFETRDKCSLCKCENNLVTIKDWSYFDKILLNLNMQRRSGCRVCLECISHVNSISRVKSAFFRKFPHLVKTTIKSQPRIFSNLNQLCKVLRPSKQYNLKQYKDKKLSKQILFVSLKLSDKIRKVQPPFQMRMKLKPKTVSNKLVTKGSRKTSTGRIEKPRKRTSRIKFIDKNLIINLIKVDLEELKRSNNILLTPTSNQMVPEDPQSSTKKSVTFANNLTTDPGSSNIPQNGTPLKSSLKKIHFSIEEDESNESEIQDEELNSNIAELLKSMQEDNSNIEIVVESDKIDHTDVADKSNEPVIEKSNGIDEKSVDENETGNHIVIDVPNSVTKSDENRNPDLVRLIDASLPLRSLSDEDDLVTFKQYKQLNESVSTPDVNLKDQPTKNTEVAG